MKRLTGLIYLTFVMFVAASAKADIFQWEYVDPFDHSQGVQQSSTLAPGGSGVTAAPYADFTYRNLTKAYLISADLSSSTAWGVNLTAADLTTANLGGVNFEGATLTGANFNQANLGGADLLSANLAGAALTQVNLAGAHFEYASLSGANLTGASVQDAIFYYSNLTAAQLQSTASFLARDLSGIGLGGNPIDLSGIDLSGFDLRDAVVSSVDLSGANLTGALVQGADFSSSNLSVTQLQTTASYQARDLNGIGLDQYNLPGIDLSGVNLTGAHLYGSTLTGANLSGAQIQGADLSYSNLTAAQLVSTASYLAHDLHGTRMESNTLNLSGIDLSGFNLNGASLGASNLSGANFNQANLANAQLNSTTLTGADLSGAKIQGASFSYSNLTAAQLQSTASFQAHNLSYTGLGGTDLSGMNLSGFDLRGAFLVTTNLNGANLTGANLDFSSLAYANLAGAQLQGADLSYTGLTAAQLQSTASYQAHNLSGTRMANGQFSGIDLSGFNLQGSDLYVADLRYANLSHANLTNVTLYSASLLNANLSQANLSGSQLSTAYLSGANFSGAVVTGTGFASTTSGGFTKEQLYSTASYQQHDLHGIALGSNNLSGWNFGGQNLAGVGFESSDLTGADLSQTNLSGAHLYFANLSGANLTGADSRGAQNLATATLAGANLTNFIQPNGHINGLDLGPGGTLLVRDSATNFPITVDDHLTMLPGGALQTAFGAGVWNSTIGFAAGAPVSLGGTLDLEFAQGVNAADQVGHTYHVFNWNGAAPSGTLGVSSPYNWDVSNLYTTGDVKLLSAPPLSSLALTIDPSQSFLTLAADVEGTIPFGEQAPGSLTSALQGVLNVDLSGSMGHWSQIRFLPSGEMTAVGHQGPFLPGGGPADLAAVVNVGDETDPLLVYAATRDSMMTLSSRFGAIDPSGAFSLDGLLANVSATLDYDIAGQLSGSAYSSLSSLLNGQGTFWQVGRTLYVSIPIDATFQGDANGLAINYRYTGQIVATATVPEPSTLGLAAIGMLGVISLCGRRRWGRAVAWLSPSARMVRAPLRRFIVRRGVPNAAWPSSSFWKAALCFALAGISARSPEICHAAPLTVMSFNILTVNAASNSGSNDWFNLANPTDARRLRAFDVIQDQAPDILGLQEASPQQLADLGGQFNPGQGLLDYDYYAVDNGDGEFVPIFYRHDRFARVDQGAFWLSATPDSPGSIYPGAGYPRTATWVVLEDRTTGQSYFVLNTHLDHISGDARTFGGQLIQTKLQELAGGLPMLVTGDFNASETTAALHALTAPTGPDAITLLDPYRQLHPVRSIMESTGSAFTGLTIGARIDFVLSSGDFSPTSAAIIRTSYDGKYPSDHYPVVATFDVANVPEPSSFALAAIGIVGLKALRKRRHSQAP